jgi:hydrogenase-4 component B
VNASLLTLLAVILAGLLLLGALGTAWRFRMREAIGFGAAGLTGLAAVLVLVALVAGDDPAQLVLPIGLPGSDFRLLLDPLSGFFALLVFSVGTASLVYAAETDTTGSPSSLAAMAIAVAGLGLVALAGDALVFASGLALAGGATWASERTAPRIHAAPDVLLVTLLGAAAVVAVGWLPGASGGPLGFVSGRAAQWPASLVALAWLALMVGLAPLAGLALAHRARESVTETTPPPRAAVLRGAAMPLAFYALLRVMSGLTARPLPAWCGLLLLLLGVAALLTGGVLATREDTLGAILKAGSMRHSGVTATALGLAVIARSLDLPQPAALAIAAVLVAAAVQAVCGTLGVLCAGAIQQGTATRHLSRLGGTIHTMPVCTICLLAGLFGLAALPPGAGFAVLWLLFQALLAEVQAVSPILQAVFVTAAAALGFGAALSIAALVRLIGVVCLGRPRTPRTAAAKPLSRAAATPLLCVAGASAILGILVGLVLRVLADPAIREVLGTSLGPRAGFSDVAVVPGGRGYAALSVSVLLALAWGAAVWIRRRLQPAESRAGPAWEGGFAASPPWLPFGDPLTQTSGTGFTPLPEELRWPSLAIRWPALSRLHATAVAVVILALLLSIVRLMPR